MMAKIDIHNAYRLAKFTDEQYATINRCVLLSIVAYCSSVNFAIINAIMSLYSIAYRLIPIHPMDRSFLGKMWQGEVYVDCRLQFGFSPAPAVFSAIAKALEWNLQSRGVHNHIHYLDDFSLFDVPGSFECLHALCSTLIVRSWDPLGLS